MNDWTSLLLLTLTATPIFVHLMIFQSGRFGSSDVETKTRAAETGELPRRFRAEFEKTETQLSANGFEDWGRRRSGRRFVVAHEQFFGHAGGLIVAEISGYGVFGFPVGKTELAMTSVLRDGTLVQTSSHDEVPSILDLSQVSVLRVEAAGTREIAGLLAAHTDAVARTVAGTGCQPVRLSPELAGALSDYTMRLAEAAVSDRFGHGFKPAIPRGLGQGEHRIEFAPAAAV